MPSPADGIRRSATAKLLPIPARIRDGIRRSATAKLLPIPARIRDAIRRSATAKLLPIPDVLPSQLISPPRNLEGDLSIERVTGIEPALQPWEGCVMPFHYTREVQGNTTERR